MPVTGPPGGGVSGLRKPRLGEGVAEGASEGLREGIVDGTGEGEGRRLGPTTIAIVGAHPRPEGGGVEMVLGPDYRWGCHSGGGWGWPWGCGWGRR